MDITYKSPLISIYNTNHAKQEVKGYSTLDTIWIIVGFLSSDIFFAALLESIETNKGIPNVAKIIETTIKYNTIVSFTRWSLTSNKRK